MRRAAEWCPCGSCTLCCKLFRIAELEKEPGEWCRHCIPGSGCAIHDARPQVCRNFFCLWFYQPGLGPEWKPDKAKFILRLELNGGRLAVHVDPKAAGAWRRNPYYPVLKRWAADALREQKQVSLWTGQQCVVILPDRDIDLGLIAADEVIVSTTQSTPQGRTHGAVKMKRAEAEAKQSEWTARKAGGDE